MVRKTSSTKQQEAAKVDTVVEEVQKTEQVVEDQKPSDAKPARYLVAKGKAITSARGILDDTKGDEVRDGDISAEQRDAFVASGHIVKG